MPTDDRSQAEVLRALLSVGEVTLEVVDAPGAHGGYRLSVHSSIIVDQQHEWSVQKLLDP